MSHALLDAPAQDSLTALPAPLAALTEKMAELRYHIILTARWEASVNVDQEEREVMRGDLVRLRKQYSDKIDEIAMTCGVQQAMEAQLDVEHRVHVPRNIAPPTLSICNSGEDVDSQI